MFKVNVVQFIEQAIDICITYAQDNHLSLSTRIHLLEFNLKQSIPLPLVLLLLKYTLKAHSALQMFTT